MQFLFLIIVNVVMAAIFYLIITLKLEKSASQFKEQKLRREMDEIIKEFNAAAERNISLLENRIAVFKKLLETTGNKKGLDIVVEDTVERPNGHISKENISQNSHLNVPAAHNIHEESGFFSVSDDSIWAKFKKNIHEHLDKYKSKLNRDNAENVSKNDIKRSYTDISGMIAKEQKSKGNSFDITIEKDFSNIKLDNYKDTVQNNHFPDRTEDEIAYIIENSEDRFSMISALHKKGCSVEVISRYSGMPEGEVKLVLNLSK